MIDIQIIENLGKEDYYLFPDIAPASRKELEEIAVVRLKVKEEDLVSPVNTELEFPKLLETVLLFFQKNYWLHALYVESTPEKKSRLRTHKGMFYGLRKQVDSSVFAAKELDLPNERSLFLGLFRIDAETLSIFLEHLIISSLAFGLITNPDSLKSPSGKEEILNLFFVRAVQVSDHVELDYVQAISFLSNLPAIAFRLTADGRDNQYLEFYGRRDFLLPVMDRLLGRLSDHFFLRGYAPA